MSTAWRLSGRIPELDGVRGLAIALVLFLHLFNFSTKLASFWARSLVPFRLSWTGVDLFFVLSGFLIGGILLDARESTNYFRVFHVRRFFRIVPIYVAVLLIFPGSAIFCANLFSRRLHVVRLQTTTLVFVLDLHPEFLDGTHQFLGRNDHRCHLVASD